MSHVRLLCSLTFLVTFLFASIAHSESLNEALGATYESNPQLLGARASTRANDANLARARAGHRPTISFSSGKNLTRRYNDDVLVTDSHPYSYAIDISQSIFRGLQTVNGVKSAKYGIIASRENLRNTEQNILLSAVRAYLEILRFRDLVSLRTQNIDFLDEQYRSAVARLAVGEGTRTDVAQSQSQRALARAQLSTAESSLQTALESYRWITGLEPTDLEWPFEPYSLFPDSIEEAVEIGLAEHPAILSAEALLEIARLNTKSAKGALLPSVGLNARVERRHSTSGVPPLDTYDVGLRFSVPIYQGGMALSSLRGLRESEGQSQLSLDQSRNDIRTSIVRAWQDSRSAEANYEASLEQIDAASLALEGVIEERDVGQRTQLDVLNAQSAVLRAEESAISSHVNQILSGYNLIASVGRLNSVTLELDVEHYDPAANLEGGGLWGLGELFD